jgi:hypothetical protein
LRRLAQAGHPAGGRDNRAMTFFYWSMAILIVGTFVPSAFFLVLYVVTGEDGCMNRARTLFMFTRLFTMFGLNILIWGHVFVGLWRIWFG